LSEEKRVVAAGDIVGGTVKNVANFGAFVVLETGQDGLVHISEIANEFIKDISQYIQIGDQVTVKVLGLNKQGKLELSIKQATESPPKPAMFLHKKTKDEGFEDKLVDFMKRSDDKQVDIRRYLKRKHGLKRKKK